MKRPKARFIIGFVLMFALMGALVYRLGTLTIAEGATWKEEAESRMERVIDVKGERGRILDHNGVVLAYSETCYNVEFLRDADSRTDYDSAIYTESLIKAIKIVEGGGGKIIDTSYLKQDENGEVYYDWRVESKSGIRTRYKNFCEAMGFFIDDPNIENDDPETWDMSLWPTAEYSYNQLRKFWYIPEDLSFEEASKIISIRQEVNLNNYRAYQPITIAYNVGLEVVAELKTHSDELVGIQTSQSTTRVYPKGTTAAHIIGYLSRNATKEMIDEQGYSSTDYIGAAGVEATMEKYLTGATTEHLGHKTIEVNKNGSTIRELENTPATNGYDVMLTIDLPLQVITENALQSLINEIAERQRGLIEADEDGKYSKKVSDLSTIETAKTGAIIVMDVNSGQVRALASYPSFDPNIFIKGLSTEQSEELFNSEEAAATTPMRNKAISSKLAPGSIFKMVTGIAGVAEGAIGLKEQISDGGRYIIVNPDGTEIRTGAPKCWTNYPSNHANLDIIGALTNSCNYYFYEVSHRLGIDKINKWAEAFGLNSPTGIELTGEATGIIGGQAVMFDSSLKKADGSLDLDVQKTSLPWLVYRKLCTELKYILNYRGMEIDDEAVKKCALKLMELQDGSVTGKGADVRRVLSEELGIPEGATIVQTWVGDITSLLNEIQWKETLTIRAGIGQGTTLITPIAVARYVSAVANEGTVYDAHIVDRIVDEDGNLIDEIEPSVYNQIDIDPEIWTAVKTGMKGVVSPEDQGTAAKEFSEEFMATGYNELMSGKTGTAQVGSNTIDIENTSWFVMFAPRDNPEIAIVVCVPNGLSGASSIPAIENILTYYFDKQNAAAPENLVEVYGIVP